MMKGWHAFLLLEGISRIIGNNPEKHLHASKVKSPSWRSKSPICAAKRTKYDNAAKPAVSGAGLLTAQSRLRRLGHVEQEYAARSSQREGSSIRADRHGSRIARRRGSHLRRLVGFGLQIKHIHTGLRHVVGLGVVADVGPAHIQLRIGEEPIAVGRNRAGDPADVLANRHARTSIRVE